MKALCVSPSMIWQEEKEDREDQPWRVNISVCGSLLATRMLLDLFTFLLCLPDDAGEEGHLAFGGSFIYLLVCLVRSFAWRQDFRFLSWPQTGCVAENFEFLTSFAFTFPVLES